MLPCDEATRLHGRNRETPTPRGGWKPPPVPSKSARREALQWRFFWKTVGRKKRHMV